MSKVYNAAMKIYSPNLFNISLATLVLTLLIGYEASNAIGQTVTRDFNFGEPLVYALVALQISVSILGIILSTKKSK